MLSITSRKGFTLVELLIVIAILAMLAAAVVLVLNPAELLAQARDAQRLSDLDTVRSAVLLYLTQTVPLPAEPMGPAALCVATSGGRSTFAPAANDWPFGTPIAAPTVIAEASRSLINNTGWVAVNLGATPGGSPIPFLPIDPSNTAAFYYAYACRNSPTAVFELNARLESERHRTRMAADGGNRSACTTFLEPTCYYEIGTDPGLDL